MSLNNVSKFYLNSGKAGENFIKIIPVPLGNYQYEFIVDGKGSAQSKPTASDGGGNLRTNISIKDYDKEALEFFAKSK